MQVFYFIISMLGGFFVIAIPWSGIILIMSKHPSKIQSLPQQNKQ